MMLLDIAGMGYLINRDKDLSKDWNNLQVHGRRKLDLLGIGVLDSQQDNLLLSWQYLYCLLSFPLEGLFQLVVVLS